MTFALSDHNTHIVHKIKFKLQRIKGVKQFSLSQVNSRPLVKSTYPKIFFFSTQTYVVSTQKNSLNERVLLGKMMGKKIFTYYAKTFCLSKPMEHSGQTELLTGFQNIPQEVEGAYKGKQQIVVH